ncbi:MAG: phosphoribosylglycinamide formyltransferase [Desulfobulbaceae bacterium]|nr:MAG: phosphoribosylglycinamide formyltransferase [Desulfobulbaceae bacterium]
MNLALLLSGSGRTLDNFQRLIGEGRMASRIRVVIANSATALGLEKARRYGLPAFHGANNREINKIIADYPVDLVLLAGFLKLYDPPAHLRRSVLNIHPSLLPSFGGAGMYGMRVHRAVHARGVKVSGCTVHFANEVYDEGPIVVQRCVPLAAGDTPENIAAKVFAAECRAYPEAVNLVAERGVEFFWP